MKLFKILALWCFILCATAGMQPVQAQQMTATEFSATNQDNVEMADTLRQDGKIYVVVAVLTTIMAGLVVYLVTIDRKVSKLEKQLKDNYVHP
ncbi:CcmD family protein [Pontibacter chitinilyticus]|uniref:CcmD family protein n=1 Tax=Pontibacter chitinilyticus TaxID=2674989 RepID=UPI00321B357E